MCVRLTILHEATEKLRPPPSAPQLRCSPSIRLLESRDTYWQDKPAESKYIDLTAIQIISFTRIGVIPEFIYDATVLFDKEIY